MKSNSIGINHAKEICQLHAEIGEALRTSLTKAIRIGELLTEQKASLPHGGFGPWIEANLPFGQRTAQNYMKLHAHRDQLKSENVSLLTDAYDLLRQPRLSAAEWDYDTSVAVAREDMGDQARMESEILKELKVARAALPDAKWEDYCRDIGIDRDEADAWVKEGKSPEPKPMTLKEKLDAIDRKCVEEIRANGQDMLRDLNQQLSNAKNRRDQKLLRRQIRNCQIVFKDLIAEASGFSEGDDEDYG